MEGSGGSAGRFAAWLLKQVSGASASGPCWFCGCLPNRPSGRIPAPVTHLLQTGYCSRPAKRLYRRLRSLRLAVQDAALSRQKQGFDSPRECQLFRRVGSCFTPNLARDVQNSIQILPGLPRLAPHLGTFVLTARLSADPRQIPMRLAWLGLCRLVCLPWRNLYPAPGSRHAGD